MTIKEELDKWQEEYLSPFCLDECMNSCCAKPGKKVLMNEHQAREIYGIPDGEIIAIELGRVPAGTLKDGTLLYWISTGPTEEQPHCLGYNPDTKLCKIQNNKPNICKDYPIRLENNTIKLNSGCEVSKTDNLALQKLIEISQNNGRSLYVNRKLI